MTFDIENLGDTLRVITTEARSKAQSDYPQEYIEKITAWMDSVGIDRYLLRDIHEVNPTRRENEIKRLKCTAREGYDGHWMRIASTATLCLVYDLIHTPSSKVKVTIVPMMEFEPAVKSIKSLHPLPRREKYTDLDEYKALVLHYNNAMDQIRRLKIALIDW